MRVYNTLTRSKEEFVPREPGKVAMYVCGPTVYNHIHIGNARTFLSFDVIRRYLEWKGFDVRFVQNVTDVDDKIINRANEEGRPAAEVAEEYTEAFIVGDAHARRGRPDGTPDVHRDDPADDRHDRAAHRARSRLRRRRRRVLLGAQLPGLRQAVGPRHRRDALGRARRGRRAQERPARLRAVEVVQARRAALAEPVGRRASRLAHRVFGDVGAGARRCPSTSTAAAPTSTSRTTRTSSRSPRPRPGSRSCATGSTAACCRSTPRR